MKILERSILPGGRSVALALALTLVGLLIAGGMGGNTEAAEGPGIDELVDRYVELYWSVQEEYVRDVDPEEAIYGSIRGMLSTLDPHSSFLDPKTYRRMREVQKGSFSGLGIMVAMRNAKLMVIAPIQGTPAYRAGIRSGDVIAAIEGESTEEMTLEEAVSRLRGQRGTSVTIEVRRAGFGETFPVTIIRDDIRTESIEHYFMLRPGVGYLHVKDFTSNTARELDDAIAYLRRHGMERLVLDLRGNPGGLLDQAVAVAERFLAEGQVVVFTRGRISHSNVEFTASGGGRTATEMPLIVLVDGGSASASEIVAGAIQDHDRGLIVGKRTWGKGLVQSVYTLPGETAMALTTARYYTPSGRLIQRDYTSLYDYYNPDKDDETYESGPVSRTDMGREVHGGGGISPDVEVDPQEIPQVIQELDVRHQALFAFANLLTAAHRGLTSSTAAEEGGDAFASEPDPLVKDLLPVEGIRRGWRADDRVRKAFLEYLDREEIEISREEVEEAWSFIARRLESEVANGLWGLTAGYRVMIGGDLQVLEALKLFPEAETLARGDLPPTFPVPVP